MTRHTNGTIRWVCAGRQNHTTYPLNAEGARYMIIRWAQQWLIWYLPHGTAEGGHRRVAWLPGRRSLTTAKAAVAADHARTSGQASV